MSMLNLKELDSMHLSVLAEIGNIGSGNAATALAGLLNTPVDIEVPNICLMDYTKAADYLGGADKTAIGMTVNVKGDMNGVMPVSYTHLDVYKRQSSFFFFLPLLALRSI